MAFRASSARKTFDRSADRAQDNPNQLAARLNTLEVLSVQFEGRLNTLEASRASADAEFSALRSAMNVPNSRPVAPALVAQLRSMRHSISVNSEAVLQTDGNARELLRRVAAEEQLANALGVGSRSAKRKRWAWELGQPL